MLLLSSNLMIRRGIIPRSEGLRLHFINNRALGLFLRVAASSNLTLKRDAAKARRPLTSR